MLDTVGAMSLSTAPKIVLVSWLALFSLFTFPTLVPREIHPSVYAMLCARAKWISDKSSVTISAKWISDKSSVTISEAVGFRLKAINWRLNRELSDESHNSALSSPAIKKV